MPSTASVTASTEADAEPLPDLDVFPVALLRLARDGSILDANQGAETLFNRSRQSMTGRPAPQLVRWEGHGGVERLLVDPGEQAWAYAVSLERPEGDAIVADVGIGPPGAGGSRLLAVHPIPGGRATALARAGAGAESAGAVAAMLAHEIKNPLSGIRGAAQLLGRGEGAQAKGLARLIVGEVDRIAGLVDGMQGFSRGLPLSLSSINLYPAIAQAREVAIRGFAARTPIVEAFDPSLPRVVGNHDALVQIILNLLRNAVEAADDPADVTIRITTKYRYGLSRDRDADAGGYLPIEVTVADDGPGVPPAILHRLFDPFVSSKPEGQGLGLALVEKLARDLGGAVHHERRADWTCFVLRLAMAAERQ